MSAIAGPQAVGMGLSFVVGVALARWLAAAEFGRYAFVASWISLLALLGSAGLDTMLVRDLTARRAEGAWGLAHGVLRWTQGIVLASTTVLGAVVALAGSHLAGSHGWPRWIWLVAGALIPLSALMRLQQSALRGLDRLTASQLPEWLVQPAIMLVLIGAAVTLDAARMSPDSAHALLIQAIATGAALLLARGMLASALTPEARAAPPEYRHRVWSVSMLSFLLMSWLNAVNGQVDLLTLGALRSAAEVGPYSAATRGAGLIPLALNVSVVAMVPTLARLHAVGDRVGMRALASRMARLSLLVGGPIALAMMVGGHFFLRFYGRGFETAWVALAILSLGQLVNVTAGPVATLLVVTGYERDAVTGVGIGTALNAALCFILVPRWGMNGAAAGAACGLAAWNVVLWLFVRNRLGPAPRADVRAAAAAS